jgi:hypothetical protein
MRHSLFLSLAITALSSRMIDTSLITSLITRRRPVLSILACNGGTFGTVNMAAIAVTTNHH